MADISVMSASVAAHVKHSVEGNGCFYSVCLSFQEDNENGLIHRRGQVSPGALLRE